MKMIVVAVVVFLCMTSVDSAQTRKSKPRSKAGAKRVARPEEQEPPKVIGTNVLITTTEGEQVSGSLLSLNAYSATVKSSGLDSTVALETVSSITFGRPRIATPAEPQSSSHRSADFASDAAAAVDSFGAIVSLTKTSTNYTDYGQQLTDLRRRTERYVSKYAASESVGETRAAALIAGALADYTWARTIWALKLGHSSHNDVDESDSPAVADAITVYPELRASAASGTKFSADKLVAGLWKHAEEKIERVRVLSQAR
ncbi:MAG TPA: hypothetical protein VFV34_27525 [Blastocatellia bacterium]|nr:hypothetical protein [Blastocatellia bacterium]